jgi:RNA polymerase sigma-70 factor (ECF subfamily)
VTVEPDLARLLGAVAAGDRAALRRVYEAQSARLFGLANAILRDREAAADALHDGFLRVSQRAGQYDPARGAAAAWLDHARRRGRELPSDDPALGDTAVAPEALEHVAASADGRRLRECLEGLEEKNRSGILLAFVHGLSHSQIADRLGLPLGTVKAWIRRGLLHLRDCMT